MCLSSVRIHYKNKGGEVTTFSSKSFPIVLTEESFVILTSNVVVGSLLPSDKDPYPSRPKLKKHTQSILYVF